ncbi:MAG: transposase [Pyrinomonadaceae bacterium]
MDYIGIDLHKTSSQVCILTEDGELIERRIKAGPSPNFARRVEQAGLPARTLEQIEPLLVMLQALNEQIKTADRRLEEIVRADKVVQRLCSVPGVGPVVATTFAATLDEASRFMGAKHVRSYLGLVPREYSSSERQHRGRKDDGRPKLF